jgi:transcriptional antiterminator
MEKYNLTGRQILIVNSLYKKGTLRSHDLSLLINVSLRTIKYEIKEIKKKLNDDLIQLVSSSKGYTITIYDSAFEDYLNDLNSSRKIKVIDTLHVHNYERVFYILRRILTDDSYVKFDELSQEIYVSLSTLNQDIKEVKRILKRYNLEITSRPHYGIRVKGSEQNKRLCISEYIFYNEQVFIEQYLEKIQESFSIELDQIDEVEAILRSWTINNNVLLSDISIRNISIHIVITLIRNKQGHFIEVSDNYFDKISNDALYSLVRLLVSEVETVFAYEFNREELAYIFMHIDSKRVIGESEGKADVQTIDIDEVLDAVFAEIFNNFDIDISNDIGLRKFLSLHIPQMIKRINNNLIVRNPIIHENLRKYLYATKVTISAVAIIESYYKVKIPLDEFGYLLFYFNMALLNLKKSRLFKIGFISSRGRSESLMYENELKSSFSNAEIIRFSNLKEAEEECEKVDIVVSINRMKSKIIKHIVSVEEGLFIEKVQNFLRKIDLYALDIDNYFRPEYFVVGVKGDSRTIILAEIYAKLVNLGMIEQRQDRKTPFISHEIGNKVVHLQDLYKLLRKDVCLIVVLEKPIFWEKSVVEVLFLIKTKKSGDKDLFILCDLFSKFASEKSKINRLINDQDYGIFMKDFLDY